MTPSIESMPKEEPESQETPSTLEPDAHKRYQGRRQGAETHFLNNAPRQEIVEREDGAKINVLSQHWVVPERFKNTEPNKLRISLYVPGLFQADRPNLGNHPLETKLLSSLLTSDTDVVYMLKPEGLNSLAYKNAEGDPHGESLVAQTSVEVLKEELAQMKKDLGLGEDVEVEFEIAGYSEGSTQGASIAAQIIEQKLGKVAAYTSFGGAGLVGYDNQNEANIVKFVAHARSKMTDPKIKEPWEELSPDTYVVKRELMGDAKQGGYEYSLGKADVSVSGDTLNVSRWAGRLFGTTLGFMEEVPKERLQAVCSKNEDYTKLVENGVPLIVLAGTSEIFFPSDEVHDAVVGLRRIGGKVLLVISNIAHDFPHNHPLGTAYALAAFRQKVGIWAKLQNPNAGEHS